jgi:hypothetical protein
VEPVVELLDRGEVETVGDAHDLRPRLEPDLAPRDAVVRVPAALHGVVEALEKRHVRRPALPQGAQSVPHPFFFAALPGGVLGEQRTRHLLGRAEAAAALAEALPVERSRVGLEDAEQVPGGQLATVHELQPPGVPVAGAVVGSVRHVGLRVEDRPQGRGPAAWRRRDRAGLPGSRSLRLRESLSPAVRDRLEL